MIFGSERFFQKLKKGMLSGADDEFYTNVLKKIEHDIRPRVAAFVTYPDDEDVVQQVLLATWISLAKFIRTSADLSPAQRNAWLMRIANNKIADYFRSKHANMEDAIFYDTTRQAVSTEYDPLVCLENIENRQANERKIDRLIEYVCSLNILPEKIIAFLYSKVVFFLNYGGTLKGSAKYACDVLNGKRFCDAMVTLQLDLDAALGRPLQQSIYDMIYNKIGPENMSCYIEIELQSITDSTSYIIKRVRKDERLHLR